jgi:hypothetical protein
MYRIAAAAGLVAALLGAGSAVRAQDMTAARDGTTRFRIRVENVSKPDSLKAPGGKKQAVGISPGLWAVYAGAANPTFTPDAFDAGKGLESQAEDGNPATLAASIAGDPSIVASDIYNMPIGKTSAGPRRTGDAFEFESTAKPGPRLAMTMMFGHSNDWFFAPGEQGISLFDKGGKPISGDITRWFNLWDAGTEQDEEPGIGKYQAAAQSAPNSGPSEHEPTQPVSNRHFGYDVPKVSRTIRVTITPES